MGIAIIAALSLGITGCSPKKSTSQTEGAATPSATAVDAREELISAARKLGEDTLRVDMKAMGMSMSVAMDPRARTGTSGLDLGEMGTIDVLMVGKDFYLRMKGIPGVSGKWLHVDAAKLAGTSFDIMPEGDPASANRLIQTIVEVERTAEHQFKGTLDLTKSPNADKETKALGDKAKAVPFTAKTDEQGRLIELVTDMSSIQPSVGTMTTTYSNFGIAVSVQKPPASQVQEASPEMLKAFGMQS